MKDTEVIESLNNAWRALCLATLCTDKEKTLCLKELKIEKGIL